MRLLRTVWQKRRTTGRLELQSAASRRRRTNWRPPRNAKGWLPNLDGFNPIKDKAICEDLSLNLLPKNINIINDIKGKAKNNTGNKNK